MSNLDFPPRQWKTADQILTVAAARAEAKFDYVMAFHRRRQAEQAKRARARDLQ